MSETVTDRLRGLPVADRSDVLAACRQGRAVEHRRNAELAAEAAQWQVDHAGLDFVRQPAWLLVVALFGVGLAVAFHPLVALAAVVALTLQLAVSSSRRVPRARRAVEANRRLLAEE